MADRPILFSAPMVRALLDGTKSQTRRLIKSDGKVGTFVTYPHYINGKRSGSTSLPRFNDFTSDNEGKPLYGGSTPVCPNDRLWVKETWRAHSWYSDCVEIAYAAQRGLVGWTEQHEQIKYPDGNKDAFKYYAPKGPDYWRPSIFMPRWASRITLLVTDVRVERLQDISEADAIAEGMTQETADAILSPDELVVYATTHIVAPQARARILFETIWDQINGDGAWEANPWVAAYSFTVHRCNIDQMGATPCAG